MGLLKKFGGSILVLAMSVGILGCSSDVTSEPTVNEYDGRVFYEIFVRAFNDSNGDGIGDLNGVTQKLDYLEELGIGGIWLMPINSSPSYHGYDVTNYKEINKDYGTMEDFENLLVEAEERDIKIYMDMVINHSSSEHEWFKEASSSKDNKYRDYYLWTDDEDEAKKTSPMGTMPWSKAVGNDEYHYGIFWGGMPDLNLDNEKVKDEIKDIAKFYIDKGVDGFRLDAVKWFHNEAEPNNEFITEYSEYCKSLDEDFILLGEVWDNTHAMAKYQDSLDSFFDFSLGDLVIDGINAKRIERMPEAIKRNYSAYTATNKDFVTAPFLSNHDQTRIMNSLGRSQENMKMAATIYLTLPGTPFIYYGEELGMLGKKPDEMIREPFIWDNKDMKQNTSWTEITNDVDKVALSVQKDDEDSIYNFYKNLIKVRSENNSLKFGEIDFVKSGNKSVMIMRRQFEKETSYVIINSSDKDVEITLEKDEEINLEKGKYDVIFGNINKEETLKIDGGLKLSANEILILRAK